MQPRDRESGPVGAKVLAPGWSTFANGQMSWGDVAFDADLVANVLGDLAGLVGSEELFRLHDRTARSFVQGCAVA